MKLTKVQATTLVISLIFSVVMIGGAIVFSKRKAAPRDPSSTIENRTISKDELNKANGKDGSDCLVAIDGTVYLIKDFSLWSNGQHAPSDGLAYCGADLSDLIDKAPHGRKILDILIEVGPLR